MNRETALLDLGRRIVIDHSVSETGFVKVLTVVVDNLEDAVPVLRAVAQTCEGSFLDPADPQLAEPVEITSDEVRRAAVAKAFDTDDDRRILLRMEEGRVEPYFPRVPQGGASVGQEMVLSLIRALVHQDLDDRPIGIVAFSENHIDLQYRRGIWKLINNHFRGMPSATLRTLVVVAESAVDVEMHCGTGTGFRFALDGTRLLIRQGKVDLTVQARGLIGEVEPFVLFLGAGFSASSSMPLGNRIRDDAIRSLLSIDPKDPLTSQELAKKFYEWIVDRSGWMSEAERVLEPEEYVSHLTLEQVVRAERRVSAVSPTLAAFKKHHDRYLNSPGPAVHDLCEFLTSSGTRAIIVETNFDVLVETHCSADFRVFASKEEFKDAAGYIERYLDSTESAIPLLKIHGSIDRPETCIVSTAQTEGGVGEEKLAALRSLHGTVDHPRRWLYVGTSMRDLDLRTVLREEDFARKVDEQWVEPFLSPGVEEFGRARGPFWRMTERPTIQDRLITETADAFFAAVRAALEE